MEKITDKILSWATSATLEPEAAAQLQNLSEMPFLFRHVAVMPETKKKISVDKHLSQTVTKVHKTRTVGVKNVPRDKQEK